MRYLLILLVSFALANSLEYSSQEYRVRFNDCNDISVNLQADNCVKVDIPNCVDNKYMTIVNNGTLYLKTFDSTAGCSNEKEVESAVSFTCGNTGGVIPNGNVQCVDSSMGVFYRISSDACDGISGELNTCVSFGDFEKCGYKSARFSSSNGGDNPTFIGYSNSYCGSSEDGDVITRVSVSCIKSQESKQYNLQCGDTSSASSLFYSSSLLLFVILLLSLF